MIDNIGNNPLFELIYEDETAIEGNIDKCRTYLQEKGVKMFHMNICSINSKFNAIQTLFSGIEANFDIIVLSEAHLKKKDVSIEQYIQQFNLDTYSIYGTSHNKRKTDGIVVYIKSHLEHSVEEIFLEDCNCMKIKFKQSNSNFVCHAFYRSPSGRTEKFLEQFENILENDRDSSEIKIVTGDFNIDILDTSDNNVDKYLNILAINGYISQLNKITRLNRIKSTCIDHIFVKSNPGMDFSSFVLHTRVSDHYPVILNAKNIGNANSIKKHSRIQTKLDLQKLEDDVRNHNWGHIFNCKDANLATNLFFEDLKIFIEKNTVSTLKKINKKRKPWVTEGLITSMKKRDKLHLACKNQPFNKKLKDHYIKYRNKLNSLIERTKTIHLKKQIEDTGGDKKRIWGVINEVTQYKKKKDDNIKEIQIEGESIPVDKNPIKVANFFNKYFSEVGVSNGQRQSAATNISDCPKSNFYLKPVTVKEIDETITKIKGGSAPGHDGINTNTVKYIRKYILDPLCYIYNLCIKNGIFPHQFKKAIICPIYKKGDSRLVNNYRPISLLSVFSKIFERCIKNRLVKYLDENKILSDLQFGFRSGRDTNDAILAVTEEVYSQLDDGGKVAVCAMDLSKAFDLVDHTVLIKTLDKIGIKNKTLEFFKNYLSERTQQVKLKGMSVQPKSRTSQPTNLIASSNVVTTHLSDIISTRPFSVPQGTVISPILYNIYVSEMYKLQLHGKIVSFADDTALIVRGKSWNEIFTKIKRDMGIINKWLQEHNLDLNVDKTKIIPFSLNKKNLPTEKSVKIEHCQNCNTSCSCKKIDITTSLRYLGVQIDSHLRWEEHIVNLRKRLRRYIHTFLKLRKFMNLALLKEIYFALIQSAIEYGSCSYGRADPTLLKKLKTTQNMLLKIIYNKNMRFSTKNLYKELEILNVDKLFQKNICSYVHKNRFSLLKTKETTYNLRKVNLVVPHCRTKKGQKVVEYLGIKLYETIPEEIKQIQELKLFRSKLKIWLKNKE